MAKSSPFEKFNKKEDAAEKKAGKPSGKKEEAKEKAAFGGKKMAPIFGKKKPC